MTKRRKSMKRYILISDIYLIKPIVIEILAEMVALRLIRPGKAAGVGHSDRQESMAIWRYQEVAVLDDL